MASFLARQRSDQVWSRRDTLSVKLHRISSPVVMEVAIPYAIRRPGRPFGLVRPVIRDARGWGTFRATTEAPHLQTPEARTLPQSSGPQLPKTMSSHIVSDLHVRTVIGRRLTTGGLSPSDIHPVTSRQSGWLCRQHLSVGGPIVVSAGACPRESTPTGRELNYGVRK